jgi:hypothetical protein
MDIDAAALERGARNLLLNCAGAKPGESLLILYEDPAAGYFGPGLAQDIAGLARGIGLHVTMLKTPFAPDVDTLTPQQDAAVKASDHALFLARLGDQLRFKAMPAGSRPVVSYVLDREALASDFGTAAYEAFAALKTAFNTLFFKARRIRVTCPLGTDFEGAVMPAEASAADDVTIKRYPMSVFAPLDARGLLPMANFSAGKVRLPRWNAPRRITALLHGNSALMAAACIHGTQASIPAVLSQALRMITMSAGAALPSEIRACCIFTPAAPMRRAKSAGTSSIPRLKWMVFAYGKAVASRSTSCREQIQFCAITPR